MARVPPAHAGGGRRRGDGGRVAAAGAAGAVGVLVRRPKRLAIGRLLRLAVWLAGMAAAGCVGVVPRGCCQSLP